MGSDMKEDLRALSAGRSLAAFVALIGMVVGVPFAIAGFLCQLIWASFQYGRCLAMDVGDWIEREGGEE